MDSIWARVARKWSTRIGTTHCTRTSVTVPRPSASGINARFLPSRMSFRGADPSTKTRKPPRSKPNWFAATWFKLTRTIANAPLAISGRRNSDGLESLFRNIAPKTTTINTGVRSIIFASGARVSDRKHARVMAAPCSDTHGSRRSSNVDDIWEAAGTA